MSRFFGEPGSPSQAPSMDRSCERVDSKRPDHEMSWRIEP